MKKSIAVLAIAGAGLFALAPAPASAWSGNLVVCSPSAGLKSDVTINKGFSCAESLNKLAVKNAVLDGCVANAGAPWADWAAGKFGSKISATDAGTISKISISLKAIAFGTCNFSGTLAGSDAGASGAGSFTLLASDGVTKVKGGKGKFLSGVTGASTSAGLQGIVTKGFGTNAEIYITIGIDPVGNDDIFACNTGFRCPPDIAAPVTVLHLNTQASGNQVRIGFPLLAECDGPGTPYQCCEGVGTGHCTN